MENVLEIRYAPGDIEAYQKEILSSELTPLFLPVSWIEHAGGFTGMYRTDGYIPTALYYGRSIYTEKEMVLSEIIGYAASLIRLVAEAENRYIFMEDFEVDSSLLYIRADKKAAQDVRLIWKKGTGHGFGRDTRIGFSKGVMSIITPLSGFFGEELSGYISEAERIIFDMSPGIMAMSHRLGELKKDIIRKSEKTKKY